MTLAAGLVGVVLVALFATGILGSYKGSKLGLLTPPYMTPTDLASDRTVGNANAPVTLDVWSDFQCTACGSFVRNTEPQVVSNLVETGKLKLSYHDFIIIDSYVSGGHESIDAATAARCAAEQGKFWPYHDWLFANQKAENSNAFKRQKLDDIAVAAGLDQGTFDACYDGGKTRSAAEAESNQGLKLQFTDANGQATTGIAHTPTLLINGKEVASYDAIVAAVNAATSASSSASPASPSPSGSTTP